MIWSEFELACLRTAKEGMDTSAGMVGEMAELVELWKNVVQDGRSVSEERFIEECGDFLFYVAADPLNSGLDPEYIDSPSAIWWRLFTGIYMFCTGSGDSSMPCNAALTLVKECTGTTLTARELFTKVAEFNVAKLKRRFPDGYVKGGGNR